MAIFISLGLGLAFPFLLISLVPALGNRLPKPGPWMNTFKQALAFPIYATVIWLIWVLGQQGGIDAIAAILAAMMVAALGLWFGKQSSSGTMKALALVAFAGVIALAIFAGRQTVDPAVDKETWSTGRVESVVEPVPNLTRQRRRSVASMGPRLGAIRRLPFLGRGMSGEQNVRLHQCLSVPLLRKRRTTSSELHSQRV